MRKNILLCHLDGGLHCQPVGQVHFLTNVLDYGMDVQAGFRSKELFIMKTSQQFRYSKKTMMTKKQDMSWNCDLPPWRGQAIFLKIMGV